MLLKDIESKAIRIIEEALSYSTNEIKKEHNLESDLHMDKLDIVEIIMDLEEEFNIDISDEEMEEFSTVQSIINCVESKIE